MELEFLKHRLLIGYSALAKYDELANIRGEVLESIHKKMFKKQKKKHLLYSFLLVNLIFFGGWSLFILLASGNIFTDLIPITMEVLFFDEFIFGVIAHVLNIGLFVKFYTYFNENVNIGAMETTYWNDPIVANETQKYGIADKKVENLLSSEQFKTDIDFIPKKYRTSNAVSYIYNLLESQRADSFKEALNVYEDDLHKMRLENMHQQILEASRNAEIAARNAESAAANAESNSQNAAFYAAVSTYRNI